MSTKTWLAASLIAVFFLVAACAPGSAPVGQTWVLATITPAGNVAPAAGPVVTPAPVVVITTTPAAGSAAPAAPAADVPATGLVVIPPVFNPPVVGNLTNTPTRPTGMLLGDVDVLVGDHYKVANGGTAGTAAIVVSDGSMVMRTVVPGASVSVFPVNLDWAIRSHANSGCDNNAGCVYVKIYTFQAGQLVQLQLVTIQGPDQWDWQDVDPATMW